MKGKKSKQGKENKQGKLAVNTVTGQIFDTIRQAYESKYQVCSLTHFRNMLNGTNKNYTIFKKV